MTQVPYNAAHTLIGPVVNSSGLPLSVAPLDTQIYVDGVAWGNTGSATPFGTASAAGLLTVPFSGPLAGVSVIPGALRRIDVQIPTIILPYWTQLFIMSLNAANQNAVQAVAGPGDLADELNLLLQSENRPAFYLTGNVMVNGVSATDFYVPLGVYNGQTYYGGITSGTICWFGGTSWWLSANQGTSNPSISTSPIGSEFLGAQPFGISLGAASGSGTVVWFPAFDPSGKPAGTAAIAGVGLNQPVIVNITGTDEIVTVNQ